MDVANHLVRPTRRLGRVNPRRLRGAPAYLVLLPGGFAVPVLLPVRRWALTPPFRPCLIRLRGHRRFVFCCTFRRVAPPWCYQAQYPAEPGLSSALANSDALIHPFTVAPQRAGRAGMVPSCPVRREAMASATRTAAVPPGGPTKRGMGPLWSPRALLPASASGKGPGPGGKPPPGLHPPRTA